MENTWYPHINTETLAALRDEYLGLTRNRPRSAVVKRYFDDFRSSYVYNTNAIEGNPITHADTAYIINSNSFLENYSAIHNMEVIGSGKAWDYVLTLPPLTMETVLNIHRRALFFDEENAGVFRKSPVYVGDKQMPGPELIKDGMESLLKPGEEDVFKRAARFHLVFENLHPFIDGNGRAGRMLINLQLMREGFLPINIKHNAAGRYYRCFRQYDVSRKKGLREMLDLITKYAYDELTGLIAAIRANSR